MKYEIVVKIKNKHPLVTCNFSTSKHHGNNENSDKPDLSRKGKFTTKNIIYYL